MSIERIDYYRPGSSGHAGASPGVIISWLVIAAVVAFVSGRVWLHSRTQAAARAADDISLRMSARYVVGYHEVFGKLDDPQTERNTARASTDFLASAKTPVDQLRAVTVLAELEGGPAAVDQLDAIATSLNSGHLSQDAQSLRTIYTRGATSLSPERRQQLIDRHGWFADLALSYQKPPTDPLRRSVLGVSLRAFWASLGFLLSLIGVLIAGAVLFSLGLARFIDGKLRTAYQRPTSTAGVFLEAFALYLAGYVGIGWVMSKFTSAPAWLAYTIDLLWVGFACCWPVIRGVSGRELLRGLGWTTGRGVLREMGAGIVGYLAAMPVLALAVGLTTLLGKITGEKAVHPIVFGAGTGLKTIVGLYLLASVWAPVVEETMFRGALFHHLRFRHRWLFSAALSALIFASLHPQGWTAIPILGGIGFAFAGIREWRGTAIASAVAHALNNAVATTLLILTLG